jgi:hypothetical protein
MSLGAIVQRIDGIARNVISERDASDNRGDAYAEHEDFPPEHQLSARSEEGALIAGGNRTMSAPPVDARGSKTRAVMLPSDGRERPASVTRNGR